MIKWITFALILFVSCILGVLGEFFALYFSTYWIYYDVRYI
jgi:H+/Cl- antiporter ClcA